MPTIAEIRKFVKLGHVLFPSNAKILLDKITFLEQEVNRLKKGG